MPEKKFDVLSIGNAIVDIIAHSEDDFLVTEKIKKGSMNLIDQDRAEALYAVMGPAIEASGGSAGNTAAGLASLGAKSAYIGKVADDHLGGVFRHDIQAIGVDYATEPLINGASTARSMIFVTPDGERSMNTYLGACVELSVDDIDEQLVQSSLVTYFEGYLWDPPRAKEAIRLAADISHASDGRVAMTLSDPFCVDRYRDEFLDLIRTGVVDLVFANEAELRSLYQTADLASAISAIRDECALTAVTCGAKGSYVVTRESTREVDAHPIEKLVDSTGAGDLYAAGFLYGLVRELDLVDCARIGSVAAAEVIQHVGPRPEVSLSDLISQEGY